jgi:hypothetical protein
MKQDKAIRFLVLFIFFAGGLHAQDERRNIIKINPLSIFATNISAFYERGLTHRSSVQVGINYMNANIVKVPISGYGITPEYRYHFRKSETRQPRGFYAAPWVRYEHYSATLALDFKDRSGRDFGAVSTSFSASQYAFGGLIGYEHISKKGFTFDIVLGPYYQYTSFSFSEGYSIISIPVFSVPYSGVWLRSGIALGHAF